MRVAITGSSGFLGSPLAADLRAAGHDVVALRRPADWDPAAGTIDASRIEGVDAVVHLAGEGIATRRWSEEQKRRILESRTVGTSLLATALAGLDRKPGVLLSASGIDYYGDTGDEIVTEEHPKGEGFLADVCEAWESATQPAAGAGIRTVHLRTTMVLGRAGGALAKMLPLFKLGLGGRMGSGRQWWSWISLDDWVAAATFLLEADIDGPVNLSAPEPVRNADFTRALAAVLGRPAVLPVPAFGPRLLLGPELASTLLQASHRAVPARLEAAGFRFRHREVAEALRAAVS